MNINDMQKMINWLNKGVDKADVGDQLKVAVATFKFIEEISPIYKKYNEPEKPATNDILNWLLNNNNEHEEN